MSRSIKIALYILCTISVSLVSTQHGLVIKSFLSKHFIYSSPWFILLTTFCIIKANNKQQNFISYDAKELVNQEAAVQKKAPKPACLLSLPAPPPACISPIPSHLSCLPPPSTISTIPVLSSNSSRPSVHKADKQTVNTDEEWIVVTEKKKKPAAVSTKAKKIKINNNKHKSRNITAKNGNSATPNKKAVSVPVPACFVKEEHDDVPFLSDNESMTESIESDFHPPTKYYSPFSTGFDLGVFPSSKETKARPQEPLAINSRLDEYLSSQQAQWTNQKQQQRQYTQKNSILNLLVQSDQVETTITPTCFKYFDDMMMSTSLYPISDPVPLSSTNKRDWDSFSC